jgi:glutathione S-transferase
MPPPKLVLHVDAERTSPYALHAFVALREKGLPFELREWSLAAGEHRTAAYRSASLTGRVPALEHDGWWLSESTAISKYLAETFPFPGFPRLFPADLRERGRARQLMAWIRTDLLPLREERPTTTVFGRPATTPLSAAGVLAAETLVRVADEVISAERTTLFATWCIADVDLGLTLQRLHRSGPPLPKKLAAYAEAQWARPSVAEWVSEAGARASRREEP